MPFLLGTPRRSTCHATPLGWNQNQGLISAKLSEGRLSAGVRSLRGQQARFDNRPDDHRSDGTEARFAIAGVGHGSGLGQRSQLEVSSRAGRAVHHRDSQADASSIRAAFNRTGLDRRAGKGWRSPAAYAASTTSTKCSEMNPPQTHLSPLTNVETL